VKRISVESELVSVDVRECSGWQYFGPVKLAKRTRGKTITLALVLGLILSACADGSSQPSTSIAALLATTSSSVEVPTTSTTTTTPPTTTTTMVDVDFETVEGTPPHALDSYEAALNIAMTLPDSTIELASSGVFTREAFSCQWTASVLGQSAAESVLGSPRTVWIGADQPKAVPAASTDAMSAQGLCPSSPQFWSAFSTAPSGSGEADIRNQVPSIRFDMSSQTSGIPGSEFGRLPGVVLEKALVWVAEPGGWVSAIELVMMINSEAATTMWGIPFDPGAEPTEMVYTIDISGPDDPSLQVVLPAEVDFSAGFGSVSVVGDSLPPHNADGLDEATQVIAPTVTATDWRGNQTTIGPDGRPKIVVFLAHWCPHCQAEVPLISQWLDEGRLDPGVDLYSAAVMTDHNRDNWPPQQWLEAEQWEPPVLMDDAASSIAFSFGVNAVPFFVVLDGENRVLLRAAGGLQPDNLDTLVEIALQG